MDFRRPFIAAAAAFAIAACGTGDDHTPEGTPEGPEVAPIPGLSPGDALADTLNQPAPTQPGAQPLPDRPLPPIDSPPPPR